MKTSERSLKVFSRGRKAEARVDCFKVHCDVVTAQNAEQLWYKAFANEATSRLECPVNEPSCSLAGAPGSSFVRDYIVAALLRVLNSLSRWKGDGAAKSVSSRAKVWSLRWGDQTKACPMDFLKFYLTNWYGNEITVEARKVWKPQHLLCKALQQPRESKK